MGRRGRCSDRMEIAKGQAGLGQGLKARSVRQSRDRKNRAEHDVMDVKD